MLQILSTLLIFPISYWKHLLTKLSRVTKLLRWKKQTRWQQPKCYKIEVSDWVSLEKQPIDQFPGFFFLTKTTPPHAVASARLSPHTLFCSIQFFLYSTKSVASDDHLRVRFWQKWEGKTPFYKKKPDPRRETGLKTRCRREPQMINSWWLNEGWRINT